MDQDIIAAIGGLRRALGALLGDAYIKCQPVDLPAAANSIELAAAALVEALRAAATTDQTRDAQPGDVINHDDEEER